ncbi:unnamed protein product [Caenorhabditis brenneri]
MSSTSVSLESLQYLLQYMDANRRFEIYNRCPSLRELEKSIPLKIKTLVLEERRIVVNDTSYKLGIIQKYIVGETPRFVAESNEYGGVDYEMDRYGVRDQLDAYTVTPGDVNMTLGRQPWIINEEDDIMNLENNIQQYEVLLAQQRERRPNGNRGKVNWLKRVMKVAQTIISDYHRRRNNQPSNYEHFVQITTSRAVDGQEQKTIQRYIHNKKYSEALKHLSIVLFGGRSSPIYVTKFNFNCHLGVIRLPVGVKFHIDKLMFPGAAGKTLEALAPIIQNSSCPLKELCVIFLLDDDVNNPIVKTARILKIREPLRNILQTLPTITNPVVHIAMSQDDEVLEELIANWVASNRPIGTEYTIHLHVPRHLLCHETHFANQVEDTLKKLNGVPIDDESVMIPISDAINLKISYGPFPEFAPRSRWAVKLLNEAC